MEIGVFSVPTAKRVTAATRWVEAHGSPNTDRTVVLTQSGILFRNDSGHTIPAYGCFQATGTVEDQNNNYVTAVRPISWTGAVVGPFFFNGPYEVINGEYGNAQVGPIFRAIKDSTTLSVGMRIGPVAGAFTVGKGCLYSYIGEDDVATDCIKIMSNETPLLATTNGVIAAGGSGIVTVRVPSAGGWSAGSVTYTARNDATTDILGGARVMIFPVDAKWHAVGIC